MDSLIAAKPDQWRLYALRGRARAEQEQWKEAGLDFARAMDLGAERQLTFLGHLACAQLMASDTNQYYLTSTRLLEFAELDKNPASAALAAWFAAGLNPWPVSSERALALATFAVENDPKERFHQRVLGSVLLRAHRPADALEHLKAAETERVDAGAGIAHALLALAYQCLKQPAEAGLHRGKLAQFMAEEETRGRAGIRWSDWAQLRLLRRELEQTPQGVDK